MFFFRIFRELSQVHARIADELLPPPVFPSTPFVESLASLPSSIPFSNPIIPGEIFPRPYLFGLHELSFKRSKELLSNRMFHDHQQLIAKTLYEGEVKKVEEEYEMATKGVQLKLMEAILEKKKRLMEEKSSEVALVPLVLSGEALLSFQRILRFPFSLTDFLSLSLFQQLNSMDFVHTVLENYDKLLRKKLHHHHQQLNLLTISILLQFQVH